ncbi:MAG: hypothetical protein NTW21_12690 [Verrucomicrobia bacterium]|nr:hypothetical protein [Verrucomicrobiota bacterium]
MRTIDCTVVGAGLSEIAFDGTHLVATGDFDPFSPCAYVLKATGDVVGAIRIEGLIGKESLDLVPFIVDNGSAILIIGRVSAKALRDAMPQ